MVNSACLIKKSQKRKELKSDAWIRIEIELLWQESKFDTCGNASSWVLVGRNEIIFVAIIENIASIANSVQVAL